MALARWFDGLVTPAVRDRPLAFFEGTSISYGEVRDRAWALGSALQRLQVAGERVVTMLPNDFDLLVTQIAILHAGGIAVPVMAEGTPDDMRHFIEDSQAAVVIATPERWAEVAPILKKLPATVILSREPDRSLGGSGLHLLPELEEQGASIGLDPVGVRVTDPMALMYTSGSTSRPKGVVLDAAGFIKDAAIQPERFGFKDGENALGVMQLFHIAGWHQALAIALGCRGGLMMQTRFSASRFWSDVEETNTVGGLLMPAMMAILLARPPSSDDAQHPLRTVLSHWVDDRFEARFGVEIVPVWGQTELGGLAASGIVGDSIRPPSCVGRPVPGIEIEIRDPQRERLPPGCVGEIAARSPWLMKGYWGDAAVTASVLSDGWLSTGDLGYLDEQGRLYFSGRLKAIIKRGGENISAVEVEEALVAHPDVCECACFSVPDPIRTEEVKVVLVAEPGVTLDLQQLAAFGDERLAKFKVPRYWEVRTELPRTRSLKVNYGALAADHALDAVWDRTATSVESGS